MTPAGAALSALQGPGTSIRVLRSSSRGEEAIESRALRKLKAFELPVARRPTSALTQSSG